jgi:hypothetical protein
VEGLSVDAAEELAERCLDACNLALRESDPSGLVDLLAPDAVIEISEITTDFLRGPDELAERLAESASRGGMTLMDVRTDGADVVAGVAWEDDPTVRVAEVRLVPDGDRITRLEWVR